MSSAPFGLGAGLAQGLGDIYAQKERANLENAMSQRAQYFNMLAQNFQNMHPDQQLGAIKEVARGVNTPLSKQFKPDLSFLQTAPGGQPGGGQASPAAAGPVATPDASTPAPPPPTPSWLAPPQPQPVPSTQQPIVAAGLGSAGIGAPQMGPPSPATGAATLPPLMPPPNIVPQAAAPKPAAPLFPSASGPAKPTPAPVPSAKTATAPAAATPEAPFYTPQERNAIDADKVYKVAAATVQAHLDEFNQFKQTNPGASGIDFLEAQGLMPAGMISMMQPHILPGTLQSGAALLAENPHLRTESGGDIDPNQMYQKGQTIAGGEFAILGGATQSTAMSGGVVQDAASPTGYSHAILDKSGKLQGKIPGAAPPPSLTGRAMQSIERDQNGNEVLVTRTSTPFAAGALTPPPASAGTVTPITSPTGGQLHAPLSQAAKNNLYNIDATMSLVNRVQPVMQQVVSDIGRGGNIWDAAQQRSAWHQYVGLGLDPSNIDPSSIAAMLPNVDPRLAQIMPTIAMIKIVGGQAYTRGSRSFQYISQIQQHLPDPERDTPQLMLEKLNQLGPNLAGLKDSVYQSEGVGAGSPIQPPPASAKPNGGGSAPVEVTAIGPNGHRIALRSGKWVDKVTGAAVQ